MSNNWRIQDREDNRTAKVLTDTPTGKGFTVVDAPKGGITPIKFSPGETNRIIQNFGTPNKDNMALLEALQYNQKYTLFISAPQGAGGRLGGVFIKKTGVSSFPAGLAPNTDFTDLTNVVALGSLGKGNGTLTSFSVTVPEYEKYVAKSLKLFVNGESVEPLTFSAVSDQENITVASGDYSGLAGSLKTNTGELTITFADPVPAGAVLTYSMGLDMSNDGIIAVLNTIAPQKDDLGVKVVYDSTTMKFSISVAREDSYGAFGLLKGYPKTVSLDPASVDGFGVSDYILNALKSDFFTVTIVSTEEDLSGFTNTSTYVAFAGGVRGAKATGADLVAGYDFLKNKKYAVDVVYDATADPAIPTKFNEMRSGAQVYIPYLFPLPLLDVDEAITTYQAMSLDNKGLRVFFNWGIVQNPYSTEGNVASTLMGEVASKFADARVTSRNALAVAWTDENGVGGQLGSGRVVEMLKDLDEDDLQTLDDAGINPIDADTAYGIMIKSRRTCQKVMNDYAFSDYAGMADIIRMRIVTEVLPLQIVKMNDPAHRDRVANMADSIMSPFTVVPFNGVEWYGVKCDAENNNAEVRDREEFVLQVAVKFTRKSRTLLFTLTNLPTGYDISEAFI